MQRYFGYAKDTAGNVLTGATIRVKIAGTANDATLYSDNAYTALANPFTNNSDGSYQFYAANWRYDVTITKSGYTFLATATADGLLHDPFSVITPAQITASQNDYNPTNAANATVWRLDANANWTITGIVAGRAGQRITLLNISGSTITLANQNSSSASANQFITGTGADWSLTTTTSVDLIYDTGFSKWMILNTTPPNQRVLDRDVTTQEVVGSSTETTVYSYSLPGGTLTTNRAVRVTGVWDWLNNSGTSTSTVTPTMQVKYGGTTVANFAGFGNVSVSATRNGGQIQSFISANNATNAQVAFSTLKGSNNGVSGGAVSTQDFIDSVAVHNAVGVDSTANQNIVITFTNVSTSTAFSTRMLAVQTELL